MRFFLFFLALSFLYVPCARAQDILRDHRADDPTAKLLGNGTEDKLKTLNDYVNLYYETCTGANTYPELNDYVQTQCTCTAAKIPEFMTMKNMKAMLTRTQEGDFQQGRVLMLAYMPCLYDSVHQFVYDGCFFDDATRKSLNKPKEVCECFARTMGNYIAGTGQLFIPGFTRMGFDSTKSVPNPLGDILKGPGFESKSNYVFENCVMTEERGWNK